MGVKEWPQCVQILTGDFNNIKVDNEPYNTLSRSEIGLLDAARQLPLGNIVPFTLHKFRGFDFKNETKGDGTVTLGSSESGLPDATHIDWVMYRNGKDLSIEPRQYEV